MRYDKLNDDDYFIRPDTVTPGRVYRRQDARNYVDMDGWYTGRWTDEPVIACKVERVDVRTWADGYGVWHARIAGPDAEGFVAESRDAARRAILRELYPRGVVDESAVRVRRESLDLLPCGRVAVQYREE